MVFVTIYVWIENSKHVAMYMYIREKKNHNEVNTSQFSF